MTVQRRGDSGVVTVEDEGPGVAPEVAGVVFERRISGARGTGIGLGLARSLVAAEGGTLRLQAPSCFAVTLPVLSASAT